MEEVWREIRSFPGYSVSDEGRIRNDETGRVLALLRNQFGYVHVGLIKNGIQYKRSVAILVASAFVPKLASRQNFDTPINLDGDRSNNRVPNLMWRPLWFARRYFAQFDLDHSSSLGPIEELVSGAKFDSTWDAARVYGLLDKDIYLSVVNRTYAPPTYQSFRLVR